MIWWNFQELLYGKTDNDSLGSSFLTISKKVTADNMSKPELTVFSPQEIADFCKGKIAGYKVPKVVHIVEELPRNAAGKILKKELREKYGQ